VGTVRSYAHRGKVALRQRLDLPEAQGIFRAV